MAKSPVSIPFSTDGLELAVKDGDTLVADSRGSVLVGANGSTAKFVNVDSSGRVLVVGAGVAGTPAGGVVSIQGVSGGQATPISASSLPLPTGAATEATLAGVLTTTAFQARINTLGQKTMVNSTPVVLASDQSSVSVTATQGTAAGLSGYWPVLITDGTNTMPTADTAARSSFHRVTDGTNTAAVKAASTAPVAGDPALVVAISPNSSLTASNPSVGSNNAAIPTSSTQIGGSDGTNLQAARVFDADTGGGTQYVLGAILRKGASGGSVEAGTSSDPLRVDPTGTTTQPISSTQLPAALVGGRFDINTGAWLGSTAPTVGQKTMANSIPVVLASDYAVATTPPTAGTGTVTSTAASATSVTILASNSSRKGAIINNDSDKLMYLKLGATASVSSFSAKLQPDSYYEVPFNYTGVIDAIWASGVNGNARVTELT